MAGEAVGECVVFLFDNSAKGWAREALLRQLAARLESLDTLQYFYVVAYDQVARRMFSKHSPEPRPLPPNRFNRELVSQWLQRLTPGEGVAGAKWAVMHGLQLRPSQVQLLTTGAWSAPASGYLRSLNRGSHGKVKVKLHVLVATRTRREQMRVVAEENDGTLEVLAAER